MFFTRLFQKGQIMKAKKIILAQPFQGPSVLNNFEIVEDNLPSIKDGEYLVEAEYISIDPYQKLYSSVGKTVIAEQVAKIIESKNPKFPVGESVIGEFGWRSHTVADESTGQLFGRAPRLLTDWDNFPKSIALGAMGLPGNTAYFGLLNVCKPKPGETVVVSGATGAVGTHAGQIAKIKGCRVVGITGSDSKGEALLKDFNFDAFVNYKSENFKKALTDATPKKIDCYFDNVGGEISSIVLNQMNKFGRVAICGASATYEDDAVKASEVQTPVKVNHLRMEGFGVTRWTGEWLEGIEQNKAWIKHGQLKYTETIIEGFDNIPAVFLSLFKGTNFGKTLVKV